MLQFKYRKYRLRQIIEKKCVNEERQKEECVKIYTYRRLGLIVNRKRIVMVEYMKTDVMTGLVLQTLNTN